MKALSIMENEQKLGMNNSGTVLLARLVPIKEIKLKKEFQELFPLSTSRVEAIARNIVEDGYDNSQPLHIWDNAGTNYLIDGHHRREGAIKAGLYEIPCYLHKFESIEAALKYAISLQTERRNLSDAELLNALKVVDSLKLRGLGSDGDKGKSATRSAEILGISTSRVEKSRFVEKYASEEMKKQIERGELTLNKAYQQIRSMTPSEDDAQDRVVKLPKKTLEMLQTIDSYLQSNEIEKVKAFVNNLLES